MGYKILGYAVWNGVKWYLRGRASSVGSRKALAAGAVGLGIAALVIGSKRSG